MSNETEQDAVNAGGEPGGTGDGMLNVVPGGSAGDHGAFGEAAGSAGDRAETEPGAEVAGSSGTGEITDGAADETLSDARGTSGTGDMGPE